MGSSLSMSNTTSIDPANNGTQERISHTNSSETTTNQSFHSSSPYKEANLNQESTTTTPTHDLSNHSVNYPNHSSPHQNGTLDVATDSDEFRFHLFGTQIYPLRWFSLPMLYSCIGPLSSLGMILGCVLPYVPQYTTIYKKQTSTGFSTFVCLDLLLANITRIAFWFGKPFELPLLIQSILMILAQLLLLDLCVRVKRRSQPTRDRGLFNSSLKFFWRWTYISSYLEFLLIVTISLAVAMYFFNQCNVFVESLGYFALVTESMLGFPQVIKNCRKKSVEGMSLSMVLMWLGGDLFKTVYYIANDVPLQFRLCGFIQITIDLLILLQVLVYSDEMINILKRRLTGRWKR